MKRLLLLTALFACAIGTAPAKLKVFACEPEWAALAKELAPDASIYSATTVYQDPHYIEARPSLIGRLRGADLLICSGASLETGWLPVLLRQAANPAVQPGQPGNLMAAMQVDRLDVPTRVDRSMGDVHAEGNPHVHLDPRRIAVVARILAERLQQVDAANAARYQQNFRRFEQRWNAAITRWQKLAAPLKARKIVSHHNEWAYLNDFLGTEIAATLEPKPGVSPGLSYLAELKTSLAGQPILAIVRKPADPDKASLWLANQTGLPALELPYSVDENAAKTLFAMFDTTIELLLTAAQ